MDSVLVEDGINSLSAQGHVTLGMLIISFTRKRWRDVIWSAKDRTNNKQPKLQNQDELSILQDQLSLITSHEHLVAEAL